MSMTNTNTTVLPPRPTIRPSVVTNEGLQELVGAAASVKQAPVSTANPTESIINSFTEIVRKADQYAIAEIDDLITRLLNLKEAIQVAGNATIDGFTNYMATSKSLRTQISEAGTVADELEKQIQDRT